jgi:hypothetical protein
MYVFRASIVIALTRGAQVRDRIFDWCDSRHADIKAARKRKAELEDAPTPKRRATGDEASVDVKPALAAAPAPAAASATAGFNFSLPASSSAEANRLQATFPQPPVSRTSGGFIFGNPQ